MNESLTLLMAGPGADTYLRGDGCIMKLLHLGVPVEVACREVLGLQVAQAAGIRTLVVRELAMIQDRWGIVFAPIDAESTLLFTLLLNPERAEELGRELAALHADLHTRSGSFLPSLHDLVRLRITDATTLAEPLKAAALAALAALPRGTALCHGDFHPGNIVPTAAGPVLVDWFNAASGCPAADVARTRLLLRFGDPGENADPGLRESLEAVRLPFHNAYCRHYADLRPEDAEQVAQWLLPMAAFHLTGIVTEPERQALLTLVEPWVAGR